MLTPRQLFLRHQAQTSEFPLLLEIERAEGVYMYTPEGRPILDLISGIGVSNVGHRHPRVLQAIKDQLDKYLHLMVYGELVQAPPARLAHALAATLPAPLDTVYFTNSGTEAIEGALKLAKRHTGRTGLVSSYNAYHGSTHGALSITGSEGFKNSYRPLLPDVTHLRYNELADLALITENTAAVVLETVQGEAGVRVPAPGYLPAVRQRCTEVGALLVLDEIQCGYGRTGTQWAFEQFGGGARYLGVCQGHGRRHAHRGVHFVARDFGGFPNQSYPGALHHVWRASGELRSGLGHAAKSFRTRTCWPACPPRPPGCGAGLRHPAIKEVRNCGLLMAVEFESFEVLKPIIDWALAEESILTDWFLFCDNSLRIAPPLTITEAEIDEALAGLLRAIDTVRTTDLKRIFRITRIL